MGGRRGGPDRAAGAPARPAPARRRRGAGRDPLRRPDRRAGQLRGRPRLRARHRRAGAPRARAARLRGALPLPRPVLARPRLDDRRRGPASRSSRDQSGTILGWEPDELSAARSPSSRHATRGAAALARFRWPSGAARPRCTARGSRSSRRDGRDLSMEITASGWSVDGRFIGAHGAARDVSERDRLERDLRRQAGRARLVRGAGAPRPRAARLGDPGAVLDDARLPRAIELLLDATRPRCPGSSPRCASSSATPWPRCGR